jgi:hypothetical protein
VIGGFVSRLGEILFAPFRWAWDQISNFYESIKSGISGAIDWVKGIWNRFVDFWNGVELDVPGFDLPGPLPDFSGFTFGLPDLPHFAKGGIVTHETLALVGERPEAIIPLSALGVSAPVAAPRAGPVVLIQEANFYDEADLEALMRKTAWTIRTAGI